METRPADSESGYVFHHANTSLFRLDDDERRGGLSSSAVGKRTDMYPEDAGKLIRPGDQIHFSMHLFPIGREVVDAMIQVGVWLYPEEKSQSTPRTTRLHTIRARVVIWACRDTPIYSFRPMDTRCCAATLCSSGTRGFIAYAAICTFEAGIR